MHFIGSGLTFSDSWPEVLKKLNADLQRISGNIKIRELKFLDFVVPKDKEREFLSVVLNFEGARLKQKTEDLRNNIIIKKILQKCEIEPIDKNIPLTPTDCVREFNRGGNLWLYLHLIGKVKDPFNSEGRELF